MQVSSQELVGKHVKATLIEGYPELHGRIVKVEGYGEGYVSATFNLGDNYNPVLFIRGWEVMPDEYSVMVTKVDTLEHELKRSQERVQQYSDWYQHDMRLINNVANDKYEKHNWCSEYHDTLDELNNDIQGPFTFEGPEQEFEVERVISGRVSNTVRAKITARSQDAADEIADEMDPDAFCQQATGRDVDTYLTEQARYQSFEDIKLEDPNCY